MVCFFHLAPEDYTNLNGTLQMSDNALLQCVPVMITLDNVDEPEEECFTYSIASPSSVPGLTLNPTEAMICITDREGELQYKHVVLCSIDSFTILSTCRSDSASAKTLLAAEFLLCE